MNIDIRKNIISNLKGNSKEEILNTIKTTISSKDELILPGLGVLFEIIWNDKDTDLQTKIIDLIHKKMN